MSCGHHFSCTTIHGRLKPPILWSEPGTAGLAARTEAKDGAQWSALDTLPQPPSPSRTPGSWVPSALLGLQSRAAWQPALRAVPTGEPGPGPAPHLPHPSLLSGKDDDRIAPTLLQGAAGRSSVNREVRMSCVWAWGRHVTGGRCRGSGVGQGCLGHMATQVSTRPWPDL